MAEKVNKCKKFGLLSRYEHASLDNLHPNTPKDIKKIISMHVRCSKEKFYKDRNSFFISSEQRIGKTWALHAIANNIIDTYKEYSVYYINMEELGREIFTKSFNGESRASEIAGKTVLMIDDVGLRKSSDLFVGKFEDMIRWRTSNNKITYIASKIYSEAFIDFYGESLYDFIRGEYIDMYINVEKHFNIGKIILEEKLGKR